MLGLLRVGQAHRPQLVGQHPAQLQLARRTGIRRGALAGRRVDAHIPQKSLRADALGRSWLYQFRGSEVGSWSSTIFTDSSRLLVGCRQRTQLMTKDAADGRCERSLSGVRHRKRGRRRVGVARSAIPARTSTPQAAIDRYRRELLEKYESDFIPYTFQVPISVAVGKIAADYRLIDVAVLDEPQFRPHVITEHFWRGWESYRRPTLVSFNGRTFDLPLLELAAFRYRHQRARLVQRDGQELRAVSQPLQSRRPHRPAGDADQFRLDAIHRRAEPGGQPARQARQDGRARPHGAGPVRRRASWPRSTTTAAATCSTRTSCSCARACCSARSRSTRSKD